MRKILLIVLGMLVLIPGIVYGSSAGDFIVNRQSTYAVPYGITKVLILDLTLPVPTENETLQLSSIKIHNIGTADHIVISKLVIWEDGVASGWNGDEKEIFIINLAPFFDTAISGDFREYSKDDPWRRIFVTVDLKSNFINEKTLQPQLLKDSVIFTNPTVNGPTDTAVTGFERIIRYGAFTPTIPVSPIAKKGEALSSSVIRWYFTDMSNNEFGFKILDSNLKIVAKEEQNDLSYIDETGLEPDTEYSGRRVVAFNDRGESLSSSLTVFSSARTLSLPEVEEVEEEEVPEEIPEEEVEEVEEKPISEMTVEEIKTKIAEIMAQIESLRVQLIESEEEEPVSGCTIVSFNRDLKEGMTGDDVECLQIILNSDVNTQVAASGVGSPGNETSYFGPLTKAAVIKFQEKYTSEVLASWGLTSGTGFVSKTTRAKLNKILGE